MASVLLLKMVETGKFHLTAGADEGSIQALSTCSFHLLFLPALFT